MRMIPERSIGCGANRARPQREAAPGMSPSAAHAGTNTRAEVDLLQAGKELPRRLAGAGRAARSVWARGEQAAGHFGGAMGQTSVSSGWPAWELCSSGQQCLNLFTYQSALVVWGPGNQAERICMCSRCRKDKAVIYSKCLPPPISAVEISCVLPESCCLHREPVFQITGHVFWLLRV